MKNTTEKAVIVAYTTEDKSYPVVVEFERLEDEIDWLNDWDFIRRKVVEIIDINKLNENYFDLKSDIKIGLESFLNIENLKVIY